MRRTAVKTLLMFAVSVCGFQTAMSADKAIIGFLHGGSEANYADGVAAFEHGLRVGGVVPGRDCEVIYRWANGNVQALPSLLEELLSKGLTVLAVGGGPAPALTAKKANNVVPIVFTAVADPIRTGLVASLNSPEGNVTGNAGLTTELDGKRLEILVELVPTITKLGVLVNANRPGVEEQIADIQRAAATANVIAVFEKVASASGIENAVQNFLKEGVQGVFVGADPFLSDERARITHLMSSHRFPAVYQWREIAEEGGLISYGPSRADAYMNTGVYAARIVKGQKIAALPVIQPTAFELVINESTVESLGIKVPATIAARAHVVRNP